MSEDEREIANRIVDYFRETSKKFHGSSTRLIVERNLRTRFLEVCVVSSAQSLIRYTLKEFPEKISQKEGSEVLNFSVYYIGKIISYLRKTLNDEYDSQVLKLDDIEERWDLSQEITRGFCTDKIKMLIFYHDPVSTLIDSPITSQENSEEHLGKDFVQKSKYDFAGNTDVDFELKRFFEQNKLDLYTKNLKIALEYTKQEKPELWIRYGDAAKKILTLDSSVMIETLKQILNQCVYYLYFMNEMKRVVAEVESTSSPHDADIDKFAHDATQRFFKEHKLEKCVNDAVEEMEIKSILALLRQSEKVSKIQEICIIPKDGYAIDIYLTHHEIFSMFHFHTVEVTSVEFCEARKLYLEILDAEAHVENGSYTCCPEENKFQPIYSGNPDLAKQLKKKLGQFLERSSLFNEIFLNITTYHLSNMPCYVKSCLKLTRDKLFNIELKLLEGLWNESELKQELKRHMSHLAKNENIRKDFKPFLGEISEQEFRTNLHKAVECISSENMKPIIQSAIKQHRAQGSYFKDQKMNETRGKKYEDEDLSETEQTLAKSLRLICSEDGKEKKDKLDESAWILYQMGNLYLEKAQKASGNLGKVEFIRCCALLMASKVRYQILMQDANGLRCHHNLQMVEDSLVRYNKELLRRCSVEKSCKNLFDFSAYFHQDLSNLRKKLKDKLKMVDAENYANKVREITDEMSENFRILTQNISKEAVEILGKPKCDFALIGLGSLARKEATYYSDLEYVIVLEEGVQHLVNYEEIKEYFRWFAVILQTIIIGLGETVLKNVAVKGLNDLYSTDKSKNWFFDSFTPSGVACDGMAPHACITAIGRQQKTQRRQHTVELIQPVSDMAKYLSTSEHIKNGYHVKDILTKTCLILGSEGVYKRFIEKSKEVLGTESKTDSRLHLLDGLHYNANKFLNSNIALWATNQTDLKVALYRPLTFLVSHLGRMFELEECSSFEIIDRLEVDKIIGDDTACDMRNAVAAALDVRIKLYSEVEQTRHAMARHDILRIVGDTNTVNCLSMMDTLNWILNVELGKRHPIPFSLPIDGEYFREIYAMKQIDTLRLLEHNNEALKLCKKLESEFCGKNLIGTIHAILGDLSYHKSFEVDDEEEKEELLNEAIKYLNLALQQNISTFTRNNSILNLIRSYYKKEEYKLGLELLEKSREKFEIFDVGEAMEKGMQLDLLFLEYNLKRHCLDPEEFIPFSQKTISIAPDFLMKFVLRLRHEVYKFKKLDKKDTEGLSALKVEIFNSVNELGAFNAFKLLTEFMDAEVDCQLNEEHKETCNRFLQLINQKEFIQVFLRNPDYIMYPFDLKDYNLCLDWIRHISSSEQRLKLIHSLMMSALTFDDKKDFCKVVSGLPLIKMKEISQDLPQMVSIYSLLFDKVLTAKIVHAYVSSIFSFFFVKNEDKLCSTILSYLYFSNLLQSDPQPFNKSFPMRDELSELFDKYPQAILVSFNHIQVKILLMLCKTEFQKLVGIIWEEVVSKVHADQTNSGSCKISFDSLFSLLWISLNMKKDKNKPVYDNLLNWSIIRDCGILLTQNVLYQTVLEQQAAQED